MVAAVARLESNTFGAEYKGLRLGVVWQCCRYNTSPMEECRPAFGVILFKRLVAT